MSSKLEGYSLKLPAVLCGYLTVESKGYIVGATPCSNPIYTILEYRKRNQTYQSFLEPLEDNGEQKKNMITFIPVNKPNKIKEFSVVIDVDTSHTETTDLKAYSSVKRDPEIALYHRVNLLTMHC